MAEKPSEWAENAAYELENQDELPEITWHSQENLLRAAIIIDREAVAPAVRERDKAIKHLMNSLEWIWHSDEDGGQDQLAPEMWKHCRDVAKEAYEMHHHLLDEESGK